MFGLKTDVKQTAQFKKGSRDLSIIFAAQPRTKKLNKQIKTKQNKKQNKRTLS
jgi:hypothetical protein